ncbi:hypothetical protein NK553_18480 [Pseudomonas sp. ZM23]|uniref:Uncharacterized protein n=1 Tax=Pseudomonas triclosanedens TaxID=2961893 RepID=A0ABY6ZRL0_9PSED|nr:hypothetical protein [Pseudomonas triclosanedens]MCP8465942.1 hypothetical protein [Pseudomonas triclosanedens]MCP8472263.1 hypothetical protein [Pseudomonas triclosanedens]MCP8477241.1 hypothetical protein [Pseudomonas triclosanedens]WAI47421.1 hypothetical protein OU419_16735 [Pseudomonas triclosanedens]
MANVLHHKVVASLPAALEANSIYLVRVGSGFDQYITNSSGQIVAYPMNRPASVPVLLASGALSAIALLGGTSLPITLSDGSSALLPVTLNGE